MKTEIAQCAEWVGEIGGIGWWGDAQDWTKC